MSVIDNLDKMISMAAKKNSFFDWLIARSNRSKIQFMEEKNEEMVWQTGETNSFSASIKVKFQFKF